MKRSVFTSYIAAGFLLALSPAINAHTNTNANPNLPPTQGDRGEYNREHKDWHKQQKREHKQWHKDHRESRSEDRDRRHSHWNRGRHLGHRDDYQPGRSEWGRERKEARDHSNRGHYDWQRDRQYRGDYRRDRDYHYDRDERHYRDDRRGYGYRHGKEHHDRNYQGGRTVGFDRPLANTSKISFDQLPPAVRQSVRQQAQGANIEDVERGTLDGRTVYEVAFKRNGLHNEVRLLDDGTVLRRIAGESIRFPGSLEIGEVPPPVRQTIRDRIGSAEINDIDRMNVNGRVVYEVGFKRSDRVQRELQIAEDGTVIREAAGAEVQH